MVPRDGRRALLWRLRHHGYEMLIDAFLEHLATTNDLQLRTLLPCGSPALVRRHIARVQPSMRLVDWRRLARRHPAIAFERLQAWAEATTNLDLQLVACANGILPILSQKEPDLTLALVETLARSVPLSRLDLAALLAQRPVQLADLLLQATDDPGEVDFSAIAHKLDDRCLLALQAKYPTRFEMYQPAWWFRKIPPERRAALYAVFVPAWRDQYIAGRMPTEVVALLPRRQRQQEGRRLLALPALATRPEERLVYAAFLPWDEARRVLDPYLHDPGERVRTVALQALVRLARYECAHLPKVLEVVCAHLHEPDPVCSAMLTSLSELPRSIWHSEHLASMERVIQEIVNRFDSSSASIGALLLLIARFLACAPEWSATQFALVAQARGLTFPYGCIENRLSDADIRQLGPALRPVLTAWAKRGDEETFRSLLLVFGTRVRAFEELLNALELLFNHNPSFEFGNEILSILIAYRPARAAQLIPALLEQQRGWITYPAVLTYLHTRRQDLLSPFLTQVKCIDLFNKTPTKRRSLRKWRNPQPLTRGFARWTARQQSSFARILLKVIHDEGSDHPTITRAITRLAALPTVPTRHLLALARDQRPVVRDTALILLRRLDDARPVLPTLLEALHDERAVRAMYALRPLLLKMPLHEALAVLRMAPFARVTIAKEVVRLLGEQPGEEAFQELLALDDQELHRDVRVVLVRVLEYHLERDEAWRILEREAGSTDKVIALSTARLSISPTLAKAYHARKRFRRTGRGWHTHHRFFWFSEWNTLNMTHLSGEHLSLQAQQRLMRLFALLLARPEIEVRAAVLRGCTRLPAADEGHLLLTRLLEAMDADDEEIYASAASAILGTAVASDAPVIGQAIARLLPNRRALQALVSVFYKALPINRHQLLPVVRALMAALAVDPLTIALRIELAFIALLWEEVASVLMEAAATGALHADALHQACSMPGLVIGRYGTIGRPDSREMHRLEELLATSQDERLRRIALAVLVAQAEVAHGWSAEQRARLEAYRADLSTLVAAAAQFTLLPPGEKE